MPSEKILAEKKEQVSALAEQLKNACAGVVVDYKGINVVDDTKLRANLRKAGVKYSVKKNTMLSLAAKEAGIDGMEDILNGTTAIATSATDLIAPAKILSDFAEKNDKFKIKGGFIEGKYIGLSEVEALSKLPSKEVLVSNVLRGLNAPISGFVNVLNANLRGLVVALNAIAEKQSA